MRKKKKRFAAKPAALLTIAALLLLFSAVGSARAALLYYSENYAAQVTVSNIGVTLMENETAVGYRDYRHKDDAWNEASGTLLSALEEQEEGLLPGKEYPERLAVKNSGSIDTYVRVIVRKSWVDADGRDTTLSPALIDLHFCENGWILDADASTAERTVLYYAKPLTAGESTGDLTDSFRIDPAICSKVEQSVTEENGAQTITMAYAYDGMRARLDAEADAVQTHNAKDAIKSAWGVDVEIAADGRLQLK